MKDGYNFDVDRDAALHAYNRHMVSYLRTYERMGLTAIPMRAASGPIGGDNTHEFLVLAQTGESEVFSDDRVTALTLGQRDINYDDRTQVADVCREFTTLYARTDETHDQAVFDQVPEAHRKVGRGPFATLLVLAALIVVVQSTWLGPIVLVPTAAAVTWSVFSLYAERRWRPGVLVAGAVMVLAPFAAELVPWWPRGFTFEPGAIVLRARALDLPEGLTTFALLYTSVGYVLLPPLFLGRLRDELRGSEERTFLQAWTLRRLFPHREGARGVG